jgi:hypothetical protein
MKCVNPAPYGLDVRVIQKYHCAVTGLLHNFCFKLYNSHFFLAGKLKMRWGNTGNLFKLGR